VRFGGFEFAAVLAQFRFNVIEFELVVDFFFGATGHALFPFESRQLILIQRPAHFVRAATQPHVVFSRAGEVKERRAEIFLFQTGARRLAGRSSA